jgi:hypothetical protein
MSIDIELPEHVLAALRSITKQESNAGAIAEAAREFLRISRLRELKTASGNVDFDLNWQQLEELEMNDRGLPQ